MKNFISATLLIAVFFSVSVAPASAQTYYQNYAPQSQEATIAYLQGVIAQLMAQLAARGQIYPTYTNTTPTYTYTTNPTYYYPGGQVLGVSNQSRGPRIDVETDSVSLRGRDVTLEGSVDLNNASYADVWFEYGENGRNLNQSSKKRLTRDGRFETEIRNLDRGEIYDYRAVGQNPNGQIFYGTTLYFYVSGSNSSSNRNNNDDEPEARTGRARDIDRNSAELHGEVDMNDFRNGIVFFVYGEDEGQIEDVESDYDTYNEVDEDGDDLQKVKVDSDLDDSEDYWRTVTGLDRDTRHYFQICVQYEDEDDDDVLECGGVEEFETDN